MIELITPDSAAVAMDSLSTASTVAQTAADSVSAAIQNHLNEATLDSVFAAIQNYTGQTASHTERSFWLDQLCIIGVISMIASILTVLSIITQERLTPWAYRALLYDLVRHLYRNKICTLSMWAKYNYYKKKGEEYYPSDEHYLKLQIPSTDIRSNQYNHRNGRRRKIHEIELLFRNYNLEVEVAMSHIKDDSVDETVKQNDFKNLFAKTGSLSMRIVDFLATGKFWFTPKRRIYRKAFMMIKNSSEDTANLNPNASLYGTTFQSEIEDLYQYDKDRANNVVALFESKPDPKSAPGTLSEVDQFYEYLKADTIIECGDNTPGEEKIHMIRKVNTK
jgi:hypothetical protein